MLLLSPGMVLAASQHDLIWHTRLANELGAALPDGTGVVVSQVEADGSDGDYRTWIDGDERQGKTVTLRSGPSDGSNHAGAIGNIIFGNLSGIASGVTNIQAWEAGHWLGAGDIDQSTSLLKTGLTSHLGVPLVETADVQNNSWIGGLSTSVLTIDAIRRLDYTIERDNYVSVVGLNNGSGTAIPKLLAHAYNVISVGTSHGGHSQGLTTFDGIGRTKPDLVAPYDNTSGATAAVSGVAAILVETAGQTAARNSEVIKAALLAGATKHEFTDWDRSTSRPLDEVYGAGQVNAYRSYHIVASPEQSASSTREVDLVGWDFVASPAEDEHLYFFSVAESMGNLDELSVALTWNRLVTDGLNGDSFGALGSTVADLRLDLFKASNYQLGANLQASDSEKDNVEHLYLNHLDPGQYALRVSGASGTDFALAWSGTEFGMMGDLNLDGIVDNDDVDAFVGGWGGTQAAAGLDTWRTGDMNQDGATNLADFLLVRGRLSPDFGAQVGLATQLAAGSAVVPEPGSLLIATLGALALVTRRGWDGLAMAARLSFIRSHP